MGKVISNNWFPAAERSIAPAFEEAALRIAERLAIRSVAETLTYDALNRGAKRVAHAILALRGRGWPMAGGACAT